MAGRTIGQAIIEVITDASKARAEFDKVGSDLGQGLGERLNSRLGSVLVTGMKTAAAGVGALFGAALWKGMDRLIAIDNARAKLSGLGHDAKTVEAIMNSALKSVKGTAFGMGEAASLSAVMVAAGIKPGRELERVLGLVGDAATIAGTDLQDMGLIWGSVAARGKLQGDDMLQMMSRGIPVLQLLADHYGITTEAASKMVSDGKVKFADFAAAMEKGMGGAAKKSGDTFSGALKNVGAALSRLGASFLEGAFDQMPGAFERITEKLDELGPSAKRAGELFAGFVQRLIGAGEKALEAVDWFRQNDAALKALQVTVGVVAAYVGVTLVTAFAMSTAAAMRAVVSWLIVAATGQLAGAAVQRTAAQYVASWLLMSATAIASAVRMAAAWFIALGPIGWAIAAVIALVALIALNWDAVKAKTIEVWGAVSDAVSQAWESIKSGASGVWDSITSGLSSAWASITGTLGQIGASISNAFTVARTAVTGFVTSALSAIGNFVSQVGAVMLRIIDVVTYPFRLVVAMILTAVYFWWTGGVQPGLTAMLGGLQAAWARMTAAVSAAFAAVQSVITSAWNAVTSATSTAWAAITGVVSSAITRIQGVASAGFNAVRGVVSSVMASIQAAVSAAWNAVTSAISGAVARVQGVVSSGFNAVRSTVSSILGTLGGIASNAMSAVVSAISGAVGRAAAAAGSVVNGIKQAFLNVVGQMSGIGANIVQGVANGISGAIGRVREAAARIADAIPGPIKRIMGLESPSKVMRGFGEDIGEGLILGMESMAAGARRAAGGLAGSALEGVSGLGPGPRAMPAGAGLGLAAAGGGVTYGGATTIHVTVSVDDLARMGTVAEFVDMLGGARVRERQTARSGLVTV